jgi:hypothetical protein
MLAAPWAGRASVAAPTDPTKAAPRPAAGPVAKPPAKSPASDAAGMAAARRFLAEKVDLDADKMSVADVLKRLADAGGGVSLVVDPDADAAKLERRVVDVLVKQVTREALLRMVLEPDFAYKVEPNRVRIMTRAKYLSDLTTVSYPVKNLLPASSGPGGDQGPASLQDIIKRSVNGMASPDVAPWADEGGKATMEYRGGVLVIGQTQSGHERVAALLEMLARMKAGKPPLAGPPAREQADRAATRRRLKDKIDLECASISLAEALAKVSEAAKGLRIVPDPNMSMFGIDISKRQVTLHAKQMPVDSALKTLLGENLTYVVKPGYLLVTESTLAQGNLSFVAYPAPPLAAARGAGKTEPFTEIVDLIKRSVRGGESSAVAAWDDEGGPGSIEYFNGWLLVNQTDEGHFLLQDVLTKRRAAGR